MQQDNSHGAHLSLMCRSCKKICRDRVLNPGSLPCRTMPPRRKEEMSEKEEISERKEQSSCELGEAIERAVS